MKLCSTFDDATHYKVLLGILWSSLARYYFFMVASSWGSWHHQIHIDELLNLPIRFPESPDLQAEICEIVDSLRTTNKPIGKKKIRNLELRLNAAVFELYQLSQHERILVEDRCKFEIDFFYNHSDSYGMQQAVEYSEQLALFSSELQNEKYLEPYVDVFLSIWNPALEKEKEFFTQMIHSPDFEMIGIIFSAKKKSESDLITEPNLLEWKDQLDELSKEMLHPFSKRVFIEGIIRIVTTNQIVIIKRNHKRLWSKSMAQEDAQATIMQAMQKDHK